MPELPSIDVRAGDTIEVKFKLKYKRAEVQQLADPSLYEVVCVLLMADQADGSTVGTAATEGPLTVSSDDQEMTAHIKLDRQFPFRGQARIEYYYSTSDPIPVVAPGVLGNVNVTD